MTPAIPHHAVPMLFSIMANVVVLLNIQKEILIRVVAPNVALIQIAQDIYRALEINVQIHALEFVAQMQSAKFSITSQLVIVHKECQAMPSLNVDLINVCNLLYHSLNINLTKTHFLSSPCCK